MVKKPEVKGAEKSAPLSKQRIAIFMKEFVHSFCYAPHLPDKCFKKWQRGQLVFDENDIENLKQLNAPIRVFIEDVD
ncbi:MAG TPA: hypothetical protein VGW78_07780 [Candidatus Babeliales bacterium]|jgi:hypothetical protein|nr:hypothetical protein [Candidatus Babeliales bacterium]